MNRRTFIKTSTLAATTLAGLNSSLVAAQGTSPMSEFYELRLYHLRKGPKQKLFDDFYRDAALPAMKRAGLGPIGVFNVMFGPDNPTSYVLVPHKSLDSFATVSARLRADADFVKNGKEFLEATAADAAYVRVESQLMKAIEGVPALEVPKGAAENQPRIFELRIYESHSKRANLKKIEMFNVGELAIFRRHGLQPVFFGETIVGTRMPNLTYLLVFDNMAARDKNWAGFAADPEWKKLSTTPGYTDPEIVTNISNIFLRPAPYSQI